ncbi:MAG: translation initiation factor IF-3 [Bacteroidota bacterium]|nr:translation initiation factor IF-3 [Bacteroidota bacterium]
MRVNEEINAARVRVVNEDGQVIGIMSAHEALEYAFDQGLDLIEIAPKAEPPVCKVIDLGKYRYELQKREKQQKKNQHQQQLKEIRFKAATDTHDFEFKTRHAREFLLNGDKVKASIIFRGREIVHSTLGVDMLKRFIQALEDVSKIDQDIKMEGATCSVILSPDKKALGARKA